MKTWSGVARLSRAGAREEGGLRVNLPRGFSGRVAVIVIAQDRRRRWLSPGFGRVKGAMPLGVGWAAYDVSGEGFTVPRRAPDRRGEMMHAARIHWFAFEVPE